MRYLLLTVLTIVAAASASLPARADYAVWQDSDTGVSMSWPDTWKRVSNADPNDVVTIMPPSGRAHAACRMRANTDMRYAVYPRKYASSIQRVGYSLDFWNQYLAEYDDYNIEKMQDGAGLGRGFAGYVIANYTSAVQGPEMQRRAIIFAANYGDRLFVLECSAHKDAFAQWKGLFMSVVGSVDFKKADHEIRSGHYEHNFMHDGRLTFESTEGPGRIVY
ncbi:MAG: hypothetical protein H6867_07645 [Rhodospirillales bacterium]|nr:hypothetical protein [Rhodospirillales bacterium]MCB9995425.1 hypothetical protein [Rhodospirillales bacterium]